MNHKREESEGSKMMWKTPDLLWKDQESAITKWNTPMMEGEKIIELPTDQRTITRRFTDKTIEFIKKQDDKPFFVYLAHSMPHIPLYVPEDVYDPDPKNAYTCVMEHLDAETGRLLDMLRETGLDKNTYVIFTSDNGPWIWIGHHAGSAGPLRGCKGENWEGGMRVPCVMWAPGRIPAGTECNQLATTLDLLPTIAALTNSELPKDRKIDGVDLSSLLADPTAATPRKDFLYYHRRGHVEGMRQGDWKLMKKNERLKKGEPIVEKILLFDLSKDIGEKNNVAEDHPERVKAMRQRMIELGAEVEQNAREVWSKQ
jgi:arylsulfatase A-like enzyme